MRFSIAGFFLVVAALPLVADRTSPTPATSRLSSLEHGKTIYDQHCSACHGVTGDGNGPASVWLFPKPRNFNTGMFKVQSTPGGSLPSDDDLFTTITRGMPGSSMPSFTYLTEAERRDVVTYVKQLTAFTNDTGKLINYFEKAKVDKNVLPPVTVPPEPPVTVQSLTRGKELFTKMQCVGCHGETGAGDGQQAATLKDNWGLPLRPRDFNTGAFRGGHTGQDLYLRIHNGMAGTPMPPFGEGIMTPEERWNLVLYVQSLRRKDIEVNDILAPENGNVPVAKVKKLVTDPEDTSWERMDPVRVPVNPLWPETNPIPAVAVRAIHDGKRVAVFCQWRDTLLNGAPIRVQDFQDAIALQFSMNGTTPFLGMGDAKNPVNLWQWKAGYQEEVAAKHRPDMHERYASMHVDHYPENGVLFRTAEAAGNINAVSHTSPVEDANARGFGTFKSQPLKEQNVNGWGVWHDGFWNVVFIRDLKSRNTDDVKFVPGKPTKVAFAIWDGQNRDRNGRKVISNWYNLILEP
jgi:DMSO reductase family type II enzyme heme b subunit